MSAIVFENGIEYIRCKCGNDHPRNQWEGSNCIKCGRVLKLEPRSHDTGGSNVLTVNRVKGGYALEVIPKAISDRPKNDKIAYRIGKKRFIEIMGHHPQSMMDVGTALKMGRKIIEMRKKKERYAICGTCGSPLNDDKNCRICTPCTRQKNELEDDIDSNDMIEDYCSGPKNKTAPCDFYYDLYDEIKECNCCEGCRNECVMDT